MSDVDRISVKFSTMNANGSSESNLGMLEEGWMNQPQAQQQNQEAKVRPHAQAHLLSPTDKCKVYPYPSQDQLIVLRHKCNQVLPWDDQSSKF